MVYKAISKLLCSRLKMVFPEWINPSQGAFIRGRELLFNVLLCEELARGYARAHISPRCMMKIDLEMAYDSIHWDFLRELMVSLRFPTIFSKWAMAFISPTSFMIGMNGGEYGSFEGGRGLRQAGPLSPSIFVLVMEYLSKLLQKASSTSSFKFHPHCRQLQLTHLIFADDLMLFNVADPTSVNLLMEAFVKFTNSTGLEANREKSQWVMGGCNTTTQQQIRTLVEFQEGHLPFRYMGVPITASKLSKVKCSFLVEKIAKKTHICATKSISYVGRIALINSVIMGIFNFWARIFILLQSVIKDIMKLCRNYLWGAETNYVKCPYMAWHDYCKPKKHGGFGIRHVDAWNHAYIARLVWEVALKEDILWVRWIHSSYLREHQWWEYMPG